MDFYVLFLFLDFLDNYPVVMVAIKNVDINKRRGNYT